MRTKKNLFFPMLVVCIGLTLCVTLTTIFMSLRKGQNVDSNISLSSIDFDVYFLSIDDSELEVESVQKGKDNMVNDDGGFVWEKGKYYVISSAYLNENDAVLIKNKFSKSERKSEIIKENFPSINISSGYSEKEKEILLTALNSFYNVYTKLFDISVSLDGKHLNETNALLKINEVKSYFDGIKNNFDIIFQDIEDNFLNEVGNYLVDLQEVLDLLAGKNFIVQTQTLSSLIKYRYCECLYIYKNLLSDVIEEK